MRNRRTALAIRAAMNKALDPEWYRRATAHFDAGTPASAVVDHLISAGLDPADARSVVRSIQADRAIIERRLWERAEARRIGKAEMWTGGLLAGIGILVTWGTMQHASAQGGTFIIAWGPMVFGFIRFARGVSRY